MRAFWTVAALVAALAVQSGLSLIVPAWARVFDPFLLVVVYCGLKGGETHGMLAGVVAGWLQDVHFGGRVLGLAGLTKTLVGFGVGLAGTRFQLTEPGARLLVRVLAVVLDALILRPGPAYRNRLEVFHARQARKRWLERWPMLRMVVE